MKWYGMDIAKTPVILEDLEDFFPERARNTIRDYLNTFPDYFVNDKMAVFNKTKCPSYRIEAIKVGEKIVAYEYTLDVAGFKREEIEMYIDNNRLVIKGKKPQKTATEEKRQLIDYFCMNDADFFGDSFKVSFDLHQLAFGYYSKGELDTTKITSLLDNGILKVAIPLKEKEVKRIEIK